MHFSKRHVKGWLVFSTAQTGSKNPHPRLYPILFEIGLVIDTILGCGSRNQSMLAVSHRDAITINMLGGELDSNNCDLDGFDLVQFGFVTSDDFCSDGNNSSFDLVVPCLPRGALLEIVPHRYSIKSPFLKRIILLEKRTWPTQKK